LCVTFPPGEGGRGVAPASSRQRARPSLLRETARPAPVTLWYAVLSLDVRDKPSRQALWSATSPTLPRRQLSAFSLRKRPGNGDICAAAAPAAREPFREACGRDLACMTGQEAQQSCCFAGLLPLRGGCFHEEHRLWDASVLTGLFDHHRWFLSGFPHGSRLRRPPWATLVPGKGEPPCRGGSGPRLPRGAC
jgi:hypothetical protein